MDGPGHADDPFERPRFDRDVVMLCVGWYLRSGLSLRDTVRRMGDRGLPVAHTTLMRWVRRCAPGAERGDGRLAGVAVLSWHVKEACVTIRGKRCHLYRAVDGAGATIDFRLAARRDVAAAQAFFATSLDGERAEAVRSAAG